MDILAVIALAMAPGLFWLWFFYTKDRLNPEPKHLIAKTFLWGVFLIFPVALVQLPFFINGSEWFVFTVVAPVTEEYGKYLVVRRSVYNHPEFDEPIDGIIYAATAALGFASLENVFYLLTAYLAPPDTLGFGEDISRSSVFLLVFGLRALLSVPGHALWSALWGYALGFAKFSPPQKGIKLICTGLFLAILSHGIFNSLLLIAPGAALGVLLLIPMGWRMVFRRINAALSTSPQAVGNSTTADINPAENE